MKNDVWTSFISDLENLFRDSGPLWPYTAALGPISLYIVHYCVHVRIYTHEHTPRTHGCSPMHSKPFVDIPLNPDLLGGTPRPAPMGHGVLRGSFSDPTKDTAFQARLRSAHIQCTWESAVTKMACVTTQRERDRRLGCGKRPGDSENNTTLYYYLVCGLHHGACA